GLWHSSDGKSWRSQEVNSDAALVSIWGFQRDDLFLVGSGGTILHSKGDGTWTPENAPTQDDLRGISGNDKDVYGLGPDGFVRHRQNGAWQLEPVATPGNYQFNGIAVRLDGHVYIVCNGGIVLEN